MGSVGPTLLVADGRSVPSLFEAPSQICCPPGMTTERDPAFILAPLAGCCCLLRCDMVSTAAKPAPAAGLSSSKLMKGFRSLGSKWAMPIAFVSAGDTFSWIRQEVPLQSETL